MVSIIFQNNIVQFLKIKILNELIGKGAIFFGWLGMLTGLISLTGGKYDNWGDIDKMGAALKVLMLPVFYGYMIKLITMPFNKQK